MQIKSTDSTTRLWEVSDIVDVSMLEKIKSVPWLDLPWKRGQLQETWARRSIDPSIPEIKNISDCIINSINEVNRQLKTTFKLNAFMWWLDEPGFQCPIHTDGELPNTMQIYWHAPNEQFGTSFYHQKDSNTLRKQFLSVPNTGYMMFNHHEEDGSRQLLWHGLLNPVPQNQWRLSSYMVFS